MLGLDEGWQWPPHMAPFHALHYPSLDPKGVRCIAEAQARVAMQAALRKLRPKVARRVRPAAGAPPPDAPAGASDAGARPGGPTGFRLWREELCGVRETVGAGGGRAGDTAGRGGSGAAARRTETGPVRVGYLSADFGNHPTLDLLFAALARHAASDAGLEVFCYALGGGGDADAPLVAALRARLGARFVALRAESSDLRCAQRIAADGIQILLDLGGHTAGSRGAVVAMCPAPVQIAFLAYPGTSGAAYIDYTVGDARVCPPAQRAHFAERVIAMPHTYQCNSHALLYPELLAPAARPDRMAHQLREDAVVLCCFCRLGRVTAELFGLWLQILRRAPRAVLWLYKHPRTAALRLQAHAERAGIADRVLFAPPCQPKLAHLRRLSLADLALDTLDYNGHTTASDALWAGVPIVTRCGPAWPARVAASLCEAAGAPELVARDNQGYVEVAVRLATDPAARRALRTKIETSRLSAPLFDSARWARSFQAALAHVWHRFCAEGRAGLADFSPPDFGPSGAMLDLQALAAELGCATSAKEAARLAAAFRAAGGAPAGGAGGAIAGGRKRKRRVSRGAFH